MAEYKNKAPDSPKGKCFAAFKSGGPDGARAMAKKLAADGVEGGARAPKKVEDWLKEWGATDATPSPEKPASEPAKGVTPPKKPPAKLRGKGAPTIEGKRRVFDVGEPNVHGTVITEGEQVSFVRWDVPSPWGKDSNVSNEQLKDAEGEPTREDRYRFLHAKDFRVMRRDKEVGTYKKFADATNNAGDDALWVFARTKGGSVALLQRPHWGQYLRLEEARSEAA